MSACAAATFTTNCTPPGNVTAGRGLLVQTLGGTAVMNPAAAPSTGAAYIVISHGENGAGAYNNQGKLQAATGPGAGTEEAKNAADQASAYYVDDFPAYGPGTGHFDDFVVRPAILAVIARAQLGPRAH